MTKKSKTNGSALTTTVVEERQHIEVVINPVGRAKVDAKGFTGTSCEDATRAIERALMGKGGKAQSKKKPEFYQGNEGAVQQEQKW